MTNLKRVFLVMLVVVLLGATVVFATQDDTIIIGEPDETENEVLGTNTTTNTANTANTTINTTTNTANTTSNLPQTGENDIIMILAIGIFAVSAVYAYKKIVDYKSI